MQRWAVFFGPPCILLLYNTVHNVPMTQISFQHLSKFETIDIGSLKSHFITLQNNVLAARSTVFRTTFLFFRLGGDEGGESLFFCGGGDIGIDSLSVFILPKQDKVKKMQKHLTIYVYIGAKWCLLKITKNNGDIKITYVHLIKVTFGGHHLNYVQS